MVAGPDAPLFEAVFDGLTDVVSLYEDPASTDMDDAPWWVEGLFAEAPARADLAARIAVVAESYSLAEPALIVAPVPARDWLTESVASFKPLSAGRYYIHGDHIMGPYPAGKLRLRVNAATAFGSGEHASTYGCLLALDLLARRGAVGALLSRCGAPAALDMGCGSGILAMAMARTWPVKVLAADIDPEAVRVTRLNAQVNGLAGRMRAVLTDGTGAADVVRDGPYGVITANILARPLCHMARDLARLLAPGGHLILAGLLQRQEAMVLGAYRAQGLRLETRFVRKPWSTLVLCRG
jgi:ribosomal protein L11 methyltransferase